MLLIEVAKDFVATIDNKKTDGTTVEAKKHKHYASLDGVDQKNVSDDKSELYKTGGGTFCLKTTAVDEKVVTLLPPQFKPLFNDFDSSAPYYTIDMLKHNS
ncbi:unnamed protein product [Parnassius apollo]|uniref:(apollo) hypothetical protein n=1 Tax=Parnassius apollo TaxID=110799 RepID=A0A8S3X2B2_PARAO|nr:unnamed protein product [Parnassius apollo]